MPYLSLNKNVNIAKIQNFTILKKVFNIDLSNYFSGLLACNNESMGIKMNKVCNCNFDWIQFFHLVFLCFRLFIVNVT
nr:MAG TPA: hypothetical protein [Caudoviricetes sp.]